MLKLASESEAREKKATRAALGKTLIELAEEGLDIVAVDADLSGSTTLGSFRNQNPELARRFFNCGIAEQNMIGVAAGLSLTDSIPFTGSFAVFGVGRAYDQIRNTVAYSKLNVKLTPTHAGISVGPDGGSHQMLEDLALLQAIPGITILVPADYAAAVSAVRLAAHTRGPVYVRLGRAPVPAVYAPQTELEIGSAYVLREGEDVTILACGVEVNEACIAADQLAERGISAEVIDCFSLKPLDEETILRSVAKTAAVITCEEHSIHGGLASAVARLLATHNPCPMASLAVYDRFGKSGSFDELLRYFSLDSGSIVEAVETVLAAR